jgi:hypothetical protein
MRSPPKFKIEMRSPPRVKVEKREEKKHDHPNNPNMTPLGVRRRSPYTHHFE